MACVQRIYYGVRLVAIFLVKDCTKHTKSAYCSVLFKAKDDVVRSKELTDHQNFTQIRKIFFRCIASMLQIKIFISHPLKC